jgi:hypothetical protein
LRVAIENIGGGPANHCDARLRVLQDTSVAGTSPPSLEPKILVWDTEQRYEDIGAGNFALLNLVFSNCNVSIDARDTAIVKRAFACTSQSNSNITLPRIEDGFSVGRFQIEVIVRAKTGQFVRQVFRLDVPDDWRNITMESI